MLKMEVAHSPEMTVAVHSFAGNSCGREKFCPFQDLVIESIQAELYHWAVGMLLFCS